MRQGKAYGAYNPIASACGGLVWCSVGWFVVDYHNKTD